MGDCVHACADGAGATLRRAEAAMCPKVTRRTADAGCRQAHVRGNVAFVRGARRFEILALLGEWRMALKAG